jgi:hypothetical protein
MPVKYSRSDNRMGDEGNRGVNDSPRAGQPLTLTTNPKLDAALNAGWEAWDPAAREAGAEAVAGWLARRANVEATREDLLPSMRALLSATDAEERAVACAELAELIGDDDDIVADTLWEGMLAAGREADDPEVMFEATAHLAAIAEAHGDPLAAAEYFLEFLNWRREPHHAADPDAVLGAFDEVIRLARLDGEQKAAALFEYRQANFARLIETEDERATEGDWERDPTPYASWA